MKSGSVKSGKVFVGPQLRQLRRERAETQAEMAKAIGVSASYINLLENNQRSLSVQVLLRLSEIYGVDWRELADDGSTLLSDLRKAFNDPMLASEKPELEELRAAVTHAPKFVASFLRLHQSTQLLTDRVLSSSEGRIDQAGLAVSTNPEQSVHDLFRRFKNHFPELELAADTFRRGDAIETDEIFPYLKTRLYEEHRIRVLTVPANMMPDALRVYERDEGVIRLSERLDYPNKVFQLTHMAGLLNHNDVIDTIILANGISGAREQARCRVELANYFAAAVLMPYGEFLREAIESNYDVDHLAVRFGVSFEQAGHRLTTLGRDGANGIPFFFLRIDKAGNVTKRFNATTFQLADHGGACPRLDVHLSFRTPGRILPQFVEMPDGSKYFTFSRTVDRPTADRHNQDNRLAVTLGCGIEHARHIIYASQFHMAAPDLPTPIGTNCRLCPRPQCAQRAYQPLHMELPIDERRRGETRFES